MQVDSARRHSLERQIAWARPVLLLLVLLVLWEAAQHRPTRGAWVLVALYLLVALFVAFGQRLEGAHWLRLSAAVDVVFLGSFLAITPSFAAFWLFYLFVVFAMAAKGRPRDPVIFAAAASLALVAREAFTDPVSRDSFLRGIGFGMGTFAAGASMGFFGTREQRHMTQDSFLARVSGLLRVEKGLSESIRQLLGELTMEFDCEQAKIAFRDDELERIFIWTVQREGSQPIAAESVPASQAERYLVQDLGSTLCWNSLDGGGRGFGWDRETSQPLRRLPPVPSATREQFGARSVMAATLEAAGGPSGRVLLFNGGRKFTRRDLRWFEQIVRHLGTPLENVFLLRHLRARAVDAERSRISRDLHDGILQTLLSLNIQLGVLRRKLAQSPEQLDADLSALEKTMRQESEELRRMVTDLRPLRVDSADLVELMNGFAARFQNESSIAVDLFLDGNDLRVPDRVCREVFQIYRESLNNIKKHAQASHVVVKLWQDETKLFLVVDDNGQGFSFTGKYGSEDLDRLRLGPISIKERARSIGGVLTVESNPGHGARLTIAIPLS